MRLILKQEVPHLGDAGDIVSVSAGYGRNYLIPKGLAVHANEGSVAALEHQKRMASAIKRRLLAASRELAERLESSPISIRRETGDDDKLFGSVTSAQLIEKYEEMGFHMDKRHLVPFRPVKELGKRAATFRLHEDVEVEVEYEIVSENPIETEEDKE